MGAMNVFVPKEPNPPEARAAIVPETAARFLKLGVNLVIESGAGAGCEYPDKVYEAAGAKVAKDRK